jgi:hypothetical protein
MISTIRTWLLAAAVLATPAVASATGGVDCEISDKNVEFNFEALFSYSDIGGLFQVRGEMEVKDRRTHKTLQKFALENADLRQQWFRGNDLKLMIYRETEGDGVPFASVKLIIEATKPAEEDSGYDGKYVLTVQPAGSENQAFAVEGKVGCSAG